MLLQALRHLRMMISRRKKTVITILLLSTVLYGAVQVMHYQEEYSPLQVLSSAESEAHRLLKFLTSYHYQCNTTLHSTNTSDWAVCIESDVGINPDPAVQKLAYSIGPLPDYSFESLMLRNLSVRQLIFLHEPSTMTPQVLLQLNATIYHTVIVPNDPADFGRNSYEMQTVNSIMSKLGHHHVDVLKLESVQDMAHSYEVLYFMVKDGILARFHQLHITLNIDKIDENYLYGWYKTLYTVFHSAGFRLYHVAASSPLCLQVTMMESCRYFMSWVRNPGPRTFVLYPPAIDGSEEYEIHRLEDMLDSVELQSEDDVIPVGLSSVISLRLSRRVIMTGSENCRILVFKFKVGVRLADEVSALHVKCSVVVVSPVRNERNVHDFSTFSVWSSALAREHLTLSEVVSRYIPAKQYTNIVLLDLGQTTWTFLTLFLDSGALQKVDQFILAAPVFLMPPRNVRQPAQVLRLQYSELQRVMAFHMTMSEAFTSGHDSLRFHSSGNLWWINFVKE